jgi:hypothetical protein
LIEEVLRTLPFFYSHGLTPRQKGADRLSIATNLSYYEYMIGDKEAEDILASLGEWDDQEVRDTQEELSSEVVEDTPGDVTDSGEEEEEDIFELLSEVARMKASLAQGDNKNTDKTATSTEASTKQEVITCEDKTVFSISPAEMQRWEVHSASVDEAKVDAEIEAERIKAAATANEDADKTSPSSSSG